MAGLRVKLLAAALVACLVAALSAIGSFPALLTMDARAVAQRFEALEPIDLNGPTLFLSDFHLTDPDTRIRIPLDGIEHIVIVGDFFQSPGDFRKFGATDRARIEGGLGAFLPDDFTDTVHFISARAHDPRLPPMEFQHGGLLVAHVGKEAKFTIGEHVVVATHGEDFFRGVPGGLVSRMPQAVGLPLPLERIARARMGLSGDTWLVTAHSHVPALHEASRTANTGSFAGVTFNGIFRVRVGTGIRFDLDGVELQAYEGITPTLWP
ncbi:MAG: hypothetical protein FJ318_08485 [SAR202 cluster bacterium]|nr:hypothetical protein [SAR202 cluster bacterium]